MTRLAPNDLTRPELTLPAAEAELLRAAYGRADVIWEYGSGGSTVMGAELPGKTIWSVESDRAWAEMMRGWFAANPPAAGSHVDVVWSDIGATKEWGHPVDNSEWGRFARYPLEVWDLKEFRQPDVVLVDGRFRVGCALAVAYRTKAPLDLYFDDYAQRSQLHVVETFIGPPQAIVGRMAQFRVTPQPIPADRLLKIIHLMQRP